MEDRTGMGGTPASKPVAFISMVDAYSKRHVVPTTGNRYRFFRGRAHLVKYKEDIEYFRSHEGFEEQGKKSKKTKDTNIDNPSPDGSEETK